MLRMWKELTLDIPRYDKDKGQEKEETIQECLLCKFSWLSKVPGPGVVEGIPWHGYLLSPVYEPVDRSQTTRHNEEGTPHKCPVVDELINTGIVSTDAVGGSFRCSLPRLSTAGRMRLDRTCQKVGIVERQGKSRNAQSPSDCVVGNVHRQFDFFEGGFSPPVLDDQKEVDCEAGTVHDTGPVRRFSKERRNLTCGHCSLILNGKWKVSRDRPRGQPHDKCCDDVVDGHGKDQTMVGPGPTLLGF